MQHSPELRGTSYPGFQVKYNSNSEGVASFNVIPFREMNNGFKRNLGVKNFIEVEVNLGVKDFTWSFGNKGGTAFSGLLFAIADLNVDELAN